MPDQEAPAAIPLEEQIKEAHRELAIRQRVYPKWVKEGRLTQEAADRQIANSKAIIATLTALEADHYPRRPGAIAMTIRGLTIEGEILAERIYLASSSPTPGTSNDGLILSSLRDLGLAFNKKWNGGKGVA